MAALVAAIHVFVAVSKVVDGRAEPGHDGRKERYLTGQLWNKSGDDGKVRGADNVTPPPPPG